MQLAARDVAAIHGDGDIPLNDNQDGKREAKEEVLEERPELLITYVHLSIVKTAKVGAG
jgi:hypothetical protein